MKIKKDMVTTSSILPSKVMLTSYIATLLRGILNDASVGSEKNNQLACMAQVCTYFLD